MFAIANLFPIVEIELQGLRSQTTLAGAVVALSAEGMSVVALLVLATTILFPFLQLCILAYLLVPLSREHRPVGFALLVRAMQSLRPWGMIEVFLLGVLVAIVKLSSMATVVPGPALWAFVALTVMLTAVLSFNPGAFWEMTFQPKAADADTDEGGAAPRDEHAHDDHDDEGAPVATAASLGLLACRHCGAVLQAATHRASTPPSTTRSAPVMNCEPGDAAKATTD
eukprot:gene60417-82666_t